MYRVQWSYTGRRGAERCYLRADGAWDSTGEPMSRAQAMAVLRRLSRRNPKADYEVVPA